MATIDLGKIKQVFRGTYNNATAYAVDDLVAFTDGSVTSTYICTTASTGNNPSSGGTAHANWAYVAKGVADPIPSQSGQSGKFLTTNGSALSFGAVSAGKILQVKQAVKTDTSSTTSGTYITISGLSVNITPSSTSSKILVIADVKAGQDGGSGYYLQIIRDSTAIYVGDAVSGKEQCTQQTYGASDTGEGKYGQAFMGGTFLDSPNTTSQVTYAVQVKRLGGGSPQTLYVNRVGSEAAGQYVGRGASSITAMEVEV